MAEKKPINKRRLIIRAILIAIWISFGVALFIFNRGHAILIDNRNLPDEGIQAPDMISVFIDSQVGLEFFRGDRDRFQVAGSKHKIYVEFNDGTTPTFEQSFILPIKDDMYILSVPRMLAGIEPFVEVFHSEQVNREEAAAARAAEAEERAAERELEGLEEVNIYGSMFGD
jgi:hypothetical protein